MPKGSCPVCRIIKGKQNFLAKKKKEFTTKAVIYLPMLLVELDNFIHDRNPKS